MFEALESVGCDNAQGEYYLPDVLEILRNKGEKIWAAAADDYESTLGINSRLQLSGAEKILRRRKNIELMDNGVTIMDPDSTFVDADVTVGKDTIIYPFTWLEGKTSVGENCQIGPNCRFTDTKMGNSVVCHFSYGHECEIDDGVTFGPYVHLRPDISAGIVRLEILLRLRILMQVKGLSFLICNISVTLMWVLMLTWDAVLLP